MAPEKTYIFVICVICVLLPRIPIWWFRIRQMGTRLFHLFRGFSKKNSILEVPEKTNVWGAQGKFYFLQAHLVNIVNFKLFKLKGTYFLKGH